MSQICHGSKFNNHIAQTQIVKYPSFIPTFPQINPKTETKRSRAEIGKANSPVDLNDFKAQTGLSNKKWDKAIKGLTKNKLARMEKTDAGLFVSLV